MFFRVATDRKASTADFETLSKSMGITEPEAPVDSVSQVVEDVSHLINI